MDEMWKTSLFPTLSPTALPTLYNLINNKFVFRYILFG